MKGDPMRIIVVGVASVGLACAVMRQAWRMWR